VQDMSKETFKKYCKPGKMSVTDVKNLLFL